MILALNISTALFILLVACAVIIASWDLKDPLFYLRAAILFIPLFAEIRQIIYASNFLAEYPWFVFLVYFLLRCIGPLLNWHTHLLLKKPINFLSILNIITYASLVYVFVDFVYTMSLPESQQDLKVINGFQTNRIFNISYPIIQLLHVSQAIYLMFNSRRAKDRYDVAYFIKIDLITVVILLSTLQISYFIFDRINVELIIAPIIFIIAYSVILFVSIKFSLVHNKSMNFKKPEMEKQLKELSKRENEVLKLIAQGKTDMEISEEINLSVNTVRTYCRRIYSKLNVGNRTEAANCYNGT